MGGSGKPQKRDENQISKTRTSVKLCIILILLLPLSSRLPFGQDDTTDNFSPRFALHTLPAIGTVPAAPFIALPGSGRILAISARLSHIMATAVCETTVQEVFRAFALITAQLEGRHWRTLIRMTSPLSSPLPVASVTSNGSRSSERPCPPHHNHHNMAGMEDAAFHFYSKSRQGPPTTTTL